MERGYTFENVAGTSAGAIVAALVAANYSGEELVGILRNLDFTKFLQKSMVDKIPFVGPLLSVLFEKGFYEGDYFENWIRGLLEAKGVRTFRDLRYSERDTDPPECRYRLQVVATDLTRGRMLVLPRDVEAYGMHPDDLDVARAVRMSMSIPFFYEPVTLERADGRTSVIVDGGVLSNFPVWLFDSGGAEPPWPTFGYKLVEPGASEHEIKGPVSMIAALVSTMLEAHDARYIADADFVRTIGIPTLGVGTTEFELSAQKRDALYDSGRKAATAFFETWDFDRYKKRFRKPAAAPSRGARLRLS